jgi:lycopene beta-cyclase
MYDFVFVGMGASNSLILISLIKNGLTTDKKIAVLDADSKAKNDKTYCFWAAPDEHIVSELSAIISYKFNKIRVNGSTIDTIENCPYHYIRSIDLYNTAFEMLQNAQIDFFHTAVTEISSKDQGYNVQTSDGILHSRFIFDSRPPSFDPNEENEIYLHQSFYGFHIKCQKDVFLHDTFDMMNFSIEQNNFTQFMYVIPFSSNEALVELTRFGAEKIDLTYAAGVLEDFITKEFGSYEKVGEEVGCIPMTTYTSRVDQREGILNTGTRANLIKPSTGYGFKNMFSFAQLVTERVAAGNMDHFNTINIRSKKRFKFYDNLLLIILLHWPGSGKKIFTSLFHKVPVTTVFSFLEERTSLRQEIKIFVALPIKLFLKALLLYLKNRSVLRYVIAFFVVLISIALSRFDSQTAVVFNYLLLIGGLLWIGIPHGALDHMLSKNKKTPLAVFIFNYLAIMGAYLVFWYFFPIISLVVFIAYSAFHFGESELIQNKEHIHSFANYWKASMMGLSIIIFIISTHWEESINVITAITDSSNLVLDKSPLNRWMFIASCVSLSYIFLNYLQARSSSYLGILVLLVLGTQVPLLMAFGLYFIVQHSFNAWSHLKQGLNLSSRILYFRSFPLTVGALLIFLLMAFFLNKAGDLTGIWAIFFVFIACVSLPHFMMMHLFYTSRSK